jgi:hypothetical protein
MMKFRVLRQHIGDQFYDPSGKNGPDERQADALSVQHLVESGVLEALENKEITTARKNKGESKSETTLSSPVGTDPDAAAKAQAEADAAAKAQTA